MLMKSSEGSIYINHGENLSVKYPKIVGKTRFGNLEMNFVNEKIVWLEIREFKRKFERRERA